MDKIKVLKKKSIKYNLLDAVSFKHLIYEQTDDTKITELTFNKCYELSDKFIKEFEFIKPRKVLKILKKKLGNEYFKYSSDIFIWGFELSCIKVYVIIDLDIGSIDLRVAEDTNWEFCIKLTNSIMDKFGY